MQARKLWALMAISTAALSGCDNENKITGQFTALEKLTIQTTDGATETLDGSERYKATLSMAEKGSQIEIRDGVFKTVSFVFPGLTKDQMGAVNVPASDIKQSFGIQGEVSEAKNLRAVRTIYRSCLWGYEPVTRCHTDNLGKTHCHTEMMRVDGSEPVEQEIEWDEKRVHLAFQDAASGREVAHFRGAYDLRVNILWERVVGMCRR